MDDKLLRDTVRDVVSGYRDASRAERSTVRPFESVTLETAREISAEVRRKAEQMGVKAVVCVCDRGGNTVLLERMDDAYIASCDIAQGKAYTSVSLKLSTSELKALAQPGASLYGIQHTNSGRIVIFGGGEPLKDRLGDTVGGLGVSGGTEEQDTELGRYGRGVFERLRG